MHAIFFLLGLFLASSQPTYSPTAAPTEAPTTVVPTTAAPTEAPTTPVPTTEAPTEAPTTAAPTETPTTTAPTTSAPTETPTEAPTTTAPTEAPTEAPTTTAPTEAPTTAPTEAPTGTPTFANSFSPTTRVPTAPTTRAPTIPTTKFPTTRSPTRYPTTKSPVTRSPTAAGPPYPCPPNLGGTNCDKPLIRLQNISLAGYVRDPYTYLSDPVARFTATSETQAGNWSYYEFRLPQLPVGANGVREEYSKFIKFVPQSGYSYLTWQLFARRTCIHPLSTHCRAPHVFPALNGVDNTLNLTGNLPITLFIDPRRGVESVNTIRAPWYNQPLNYGCGCEDVGTPNQVDYEEVWHFALYHPIAQNMTVSADIQPICSRNGDYYTNGTNYTLPYCVCRNGYLGSLCTTAVSLYPGRLSMCCEDFMNNLTALAWNPLIEPNGTRTFYLRDYPGTIYNTYFMMQLPQGKTLGDWTISYTIASSNATEVAVSSLFQITTAKTCQMNCSTTDYYLERRFSPAPRSGTEVNLACCSFTALDTNKEIFFAKIVHDFMARSNINMTLSWVPRCHPAEHILWNASAAPCQCTCQDGWKREGSGGYSANCNKCSIQVGAQTNSTELVQTQTASLANSESIVFTFNVPASLVPGNNFEFDINGTYQCNGLRWKVYHDCLVAGQPWFETVPPGTGTIYQTFANVSRPAHYNYQLIPLNGLNTRDACMGFPGDRQERYQIALSNTGSWPTNCNFTIRAEFKAACEARCLPNSQCIRLPSRRWPRVWSQVTTYQQGYNATAAACVCGPNLAGFDCRTAWHNDADLADVKDGEGTIASRERYHGSAAILLPKMTPAFYHVLTSATNSDVKISVSIPTSDVSSRDMSNKFGSVFPTVRVHIWAAYSDELNPPTFVNYNYSAPEQAVYRFALSSAAPPGVFAAYSNYSTNGSLVANLTVPTSAGYLYIVVWLNDLRLFVTDVRDAQGIQFISDIRGQMSIEISDTAGQVVGFVILGISVVILVALIGRMLWFMKKQGVTKGLFAFLNIGGGRDGFSSTTIGGAFASKFSTAAVTEKLPKWLKKPTKKVIYILAFIQILLDIGGALSSLAFNIAILHTQLSMIASLPLFAILLDAWAEALGGMQWLIVPLTRFLADILDSIQLKNTFKWNCGGALATVTPLLLIVCALILMFIIQKHIVFRVAITLQGKGGFARRAAARFLQAVFLSTIQSVLILVLVLINFRTEETMFCGDGDRALLASMSVFTLIVIIVMVPLIFMVFGMVAQDTDSLANIFWAGFRICLITVGAWTNPVVESFEIRAVAQHFDNDPDDDDNQQEAVMLLFAQTRCLIWALIPGGLVATKLAEAANSSIIIVAKNSGLQLKRSLFHRVVAWIMCVAQFCLMLNFLSQGATAVGLLVLTVFMPLVDTFLGSKFIAYIHPGLADYGATVATVASPSPPPANDNPAQPV